MDSTYTFSKWDLYSLHWNIPDGTHLFYFCSKILRLQFYIRVSYIVFYFASLFDVLSLHVTTIHQLSKNALSKQLIISLMHGYFPKLDCTAQWWHTAALQQESSSVFYRRNVSLQLFLRTDNLTAIVLDSILKLPLLNLLQSCQHLKPVKHM